jgi:hypothetical protein
MTGPKNGKPKFPTLDDKIMIDKIYFHNGIKKVEFKQNIKKKDKANNKANLYTQKHKINIICRPILEIFETNISQKLNVQNCHFRWL